MFGLWGAWTEASPAALTRPGDNRAVPRAWGSLRPSPRRVLGPSFFVGCRGLWCMSSPALGAHTRRRVSAASVEPCPGRFPGNLSASPVP